MTRLRRRLGVLAATVLLPWALVVGTAGPSLADGEPRLELNGTICWEKGPGNPAPRPFVTITLSKVSKYPVSVVLGTVDGTAVAPDDYRALHGVTVTIPPDTLRVEVPVDIVADKVVEPEEHFKVTISKPVGAVIGQGSAAVVIRDGSQPAGQK